MLIFLFLRMWFIYSTYNAWKSWTHWRHLWMCLFLMSHWKCRPGCRFKIIFKRHSQTLWDCEALKLVVSKKRNATCSVYLNNEQMQHNSWMFCQFYCLHAIQFNAQCRATLIIILPNMCSGWRYVLSFFFVCLFISAA